MDWLLEPLQFNFINRALIAAILVGLVCSILGTHYLNVAVGADVVLVATAVFLLVFCFAPGRDLIWRFFDSPICQ